MGSSFFGFNIARSGLFVSQRALNVTAHNIANANTEGYSRQRLDTHASRPDTLPAAQGMIGTGVDSEAIKQIRDEFLDFKYRGENTTLGEWAKREDVLKTIEAIFNEPSDSGIRETMDQFFSAIQELNKNPESLTTRALVRQRGIALTKNMNAMAETFKKLQRDIDFELQAVVSEINGYARQITDLNKTIYSQELDGSKANDLRDQRGVILDKLSELTNIDYYEDSMGRFFVTVSGNALVSHVNYDQIRLTQRIVPLHEDDALLLNDVDWASGATFTGTSGKIKAILDLRDSAGGNEKGIPYYVDKLNEFIDTMANEINRVHMTGYDLKDETGFSFFTIDGLSSSAYEQAVRTQGLDGNPAVDVTDQVMNGTAGLTGDSLDQKIRENIRGVLANNPNFAGKSVKYLSDGRYYVSDRIRAVEVTISSDIENDLDRLAAAQSPNATPGDGLNALAIGNVRSNVRLYDWGSPDDFVKSLVSNLGVDAQEASRMAGNQENMIMQVENKRQSIMGVSMDEEMSEMLKYQHAYNASARMLTTIDGILDTIINRLGLVGR